MHRTFISTVVVAALTITGISSSMAQAGEYRYAPQGQHRKQNTVDPLAATVAGVIALAIIGKAIDNNGGIKLNIQSSKKHVAPHRHNSHKRTHNGHRRHDGHRAHRGHRQHGHNAHRSHHSNHWHRHGNGHRHSHPHGPRHHRGHH